MVSSRSDGSGSGGDNDEKGDDSKSEEKKSSDAPDIAGKSAFVLFHYVNSSEVFNMKSHLFEYFIRPLSAFFAFTTHMC